MEPSDRRIRQTWLFFAASFLVVGFAVLLTLTIEPVSPLDLLVAGLLVVAGVAALVHRAAVQALEAGRRMEAEGFARIMSGLSRSVSPDAIVEAIVDELGAVTGADHVVVVRRRPDARVLDATLVSRRQGVPSSSTVLPLADLDDPIDEVMTVRHVRRPDAGGLRAPVAVAIEPEAATGIAVAVAERWSASVPYRDGAAPEPPMGAPAWTNPPAPAGAARIAARIADRVREVYGLRHTLAAPLLAEDRVVGAIVISRRVDDVWPASAQRLLASAASEASAALGRAYSHRQAEALATTDALTGLPNRRYFDEFCALLGRRRRAEDAIGVLMIDIDRFKKLNDTFGHVVGDHVLRAVAGAIASAVREADVPARVGGEEFAVLLRNPSLPVTIEVGERVREAVGRLDLRRFGVPAVSVSVGAAVAESPNESVGDLVVRADTALYRAKRAGRDRVVAV